MTGVVGAKTDPLATTNHSGLQRSQAQMGSGDAVRNRNVMWVAGGLRRVSIASCQVKTDAIKLLQRAIFKTDWNMNSALRIVSANVFPALISRSLGSN